FFQAEDGIRDKLVTGVQTCALPIVSLAKKVAQALARKHKLPVYLYAKAASRPERVRLPDIRKPQYEGLAALIEGDWKPDFGPSLVHPRAGAIVVGARPPLIAFNMNLR